MKEIPFSENNLDGFSIERIRDDFIEGRFIEKYIYQEVILKSFGSEEVSDRVGYRSTDFKIFSRFPQIELRNAQRSSKDFLNRLLECCKFDLAVSPITVNLLEWVSGIEERTTHRILVDSLQLSGIELEEGVVGKILLRGDRDIREVIDRVVGGKPYILEKVQIKLQSSSQRISIHLSNSGAARISADDTSELVQVLRESIPSKR
ncbi:MAG: hypothetical protein V4751_14170 [Pseudomonadota bacterium]